MNIDNLYLCGYEFEGRYYYGIFTKKDYTSNGVLKQNAYIFESLNCKSQVLIYIKDFLSIVTLTDILNGNSRISYFTCPGDTLPKGKIIQTKERINKGQLSSTKIGISYKELKTAISDMNLKVSQENQIKITNNTISNEDAERIIYYYNKNYNVESKLHYIGDCYLCINEYNDVICLSGNIDILNNREVNPSEYVKMVPLKEYIERVKETPIIPGTTPNEATLKEIYQAYGMFCNDLTMERKKTKRRLNTYIPE